ncbi:hypothetical protein INT47_002187 [Mucor saturninus]|uniref:Uncharacterized protein n=1 Tax=Mucor saturninus TaxID=64648 RepID=A0A8H7R8B5_9FUNG|nr:hypothetical protein INT47_002187 [Mucor saturninus]
MLEHTRAKAPAESIKESFIGEEANDDEEEEEVSYKASQKNQQDRSNTPEQAKKGRKKSNGDPNRRDKIGRTRLFAAARAGHLDKIKEWIEQGANVNAKDNAKYTPLHEAANHGRVEVVEYLMQMGADIKARAIGLDTPLHEASNCNSEQCVKLLVDAGADVFSLNEKNQRPIDLCSTDECEAILTKKMKELDNVIKRDGQGKSLLHYACLNNQVDKANALIDQGADVNAKDNQDITPLHLSCAQGHLNIVKLLYGQGALVNILGTPLAETPLHQACRNGREDIVRYLIDEAEADVNIENNQGENPYHVSASFPPIRQILTARMDEIRLEKEACHALDETARKMALQNEPERQLTREERKIQSYMRVFDKLQGDQQNKDDESASSVSTTTTTPRRKKKPTTTANRKSASVERDVTPTRKAQVKLDPFKKDNSGGTQLHKFASRGDRDAVKTLLESGAKPDEKDYAGWTALHEAALHGHIEVVKLLIDYGANVNSKGADMDTPLHDATENNHCDIVELLLDHGADPFARNMNNAEPIDLATANEYGDIILVLQNANPVKKKKRPKVLPAGPMTDVKSNQTQKPKKRRLIQAADLEKNQSVEDEIKPVKLKKLRQRSSSPELVKVKEEEIHPKDITSKENLNKTRYIPNKKSHDIPSKVIDHNHPYHSPIHTPPPEQWTKQKHDGTRYYSPLYTVRINFNSPLTYYVVDLQVCLFLGFTNLDDFYKAYPFSNKKKRIHDEGKIRLWSTLKHMIREEKTTFVSRQLHFIPLDDVLDLIKKDYNHLSQSLLTITLDIGYEEIDINKKYCNLPPKIAMKMRKCGYQHYSN